MVKAGSKKLGYEIANNPKDESIIQRDIKDYGVECFNEGYTKKRLETKMFKDLKLKRLNKAFSKEMDNIDNLIEKNKNKSNGTNK